jgi:hypothetical protein
MASKTAKRKKRAVAVRTRAASETTPVLPAGPMTVAEMSDNEVERELLNPSRAAPLEEYFGPENYRELRDLAMQAAQRTRRGGPRVLILPGIMGSRIGDSNTCSTG